MTFYFLQLCRTDIDKGSFLVCGLFCVYLAGGPLRLAAFQALYAPVIILAGGMWVRFRRGRSWGRSQT